MVNLTLGDWIDQMKKVSNDKLRLEANARKLAMVLAYIFVALNQSQHLLFVLKTQAQKDIQEAAYSTWQYWIRRLDQEWKTLTQEP